MDFKYYTTIVSVLRIFDRGCWHLQDNPGVDGRALCQIEGD